MRKSPNKIQQRDPAKVTKKKKKSARYNQMCLYFCYKKCSKTKCNVTFLSFKHYSVCLMWCVYKLYYIFTCNSINSITQKKDRKKKA